MLRIIAFILHSLSKIKETGFISLYTAFKFSPFHYQARGAVHGTPYINFIKPVSYFTKFTTKSRNYT